MGKIESTIKELDLEPVISELIEQRKAGESLRALRDYYNLQVIDTVLGDAGGSILTDTDTVYQALTGNIDSAGDRIEVEHTLADMGVDVDSLKQRLISHETLRKYLKSKNIIPDEHTDSVTETSVRETVAWAKSREEAIIQRKLEQLRRADKISFDEIDIDTAVTITCSGSGESYPLSEFIDRGGC